MKNITQRLLATVVLATSCIAAHAAVDLSQAPIDITQDLIDYNSSDFGHTFTLGLGQQAGALNNYFADKYTFAISGVNDVVGLITSLKASANDGLTITGFDLRNAGGIVFHGTQDLSQPSEQAWNFASGLHPLAAGNYTLEVDGYVASPNGGSYSGNIAVAAAVPEPETYGMLMAGLGLLGVIARRRKNAQ
ncbi:PEP-CTERM sorting domain-containing protein [Duganella sp. FT3S]|uniref:PEP-CTERM sorting domain-containing protein n=1 Tax=Rugamonas fusca TaxID=2758568 RepID=A0A7W2EL37_9BURK|nr:FxDxF family PEP-CTERM protein [Rugamonas fusca]MBA5607812.1 PEP-CTERM sorting domain-containing protein [Rugamonas fusca]